MSDRDAILTTAEMQEADRLSIAAGITGCDLMEAAGKGVAEVVANHAAQSGRRVAVLCGPGNNGGDGFVAARYLEGAGFEVAVSLLGDRANLTGDAKTMAERYAGPIAALEPTSGRNADVVIDALFGAGLTRPLSGVAAEAVAAVNNSAATVVAVDVPSGLDGDTGDSDGPVIDADATVTFFRLKPGHLLLPGRDLCGDITIVDIGTPETVLRQVGPTVFQNAPGLWRQHWPHLVYDAHKYARGHSVVVSGPMLATGAARLGAKAALRIGSGLVTVASPLDAAPIHAAQLTAIMIASFANRAGLREILSDQRKNAVLIGPGRGVFPETRDDVRCVLESGAATVLDADALTVFAGQEDVLEGAIAAKPHRPVVVTPHGGEFARLFPSATGSKLVRARTAARRLSAVVVLKGRDTVIASPDGRAAINDNAPPILATAGSGDVLAGCITGLLAQSMPAFEAACAAVWLHGAAAEKFGLGLIAEDLPDQLPSVLRNLF